MKDPSNCCTDRLHLHKTIPYYVLFELISFDVFALYSFVILSPIRHIRWCLF